MSQLFDYLNVTTVVLVIVTLIIVVSSLLTKRPKSSPPIAKVGIPLLGNYIEFASNPVAFVHKCYEKFGPVFTVPMLHKNLTFLIGPDASKPFFQLNDDQMSQNEVYGFMTPVFGTGIVYDAPLKKRNQQMQQMATALKSHRLRAYIPKIELETINFVKRWGATGTIDVLEALSELTILTSSRCLHGDDVREHLFAEVAKLYHDLDKGVTPLSFFFPYAPTKAHQLRDEARKKMVELFSTVIRSRKEKGINCDSEGSFDVLQVFIDMVYKDDNTCLNDSEIVGLLIALLFAGQHTSSITSAWTLFFLLHNEKTLKKALEEQNVCLNGDLNAELDFDMVSNMEYLQNCSKEALRIHPPLILLMRMALTDVDTTTADGRQYTIPKGDIVITSPAVSARLPEVFTEPNSFDPDRFSEARGEHKTPFAYLGFGAGRHACLGQQFGLLQVKTILSILLRNFKFELIDIEFPEPDYSAMVVGPKNHLMVKYTKLPTCKF